MKVWKRLTAAVTACSVLMGTSVVHTHFLRSEPVLAVTSSETLSYTESGEYGQNDSYGCWYGLRWNTTITYTIVKESDWDESLGAVVDTEYIVLENIGTIEVNVIPHATYPSYPSSYSYDSVGNVYGASHFDGSKTSGYGSYYSGNILIEIPNQIDGIPVKKMNSMDISTSLYTGYGSGFSGAVDLVLPESLISIGSLTSNKGSSYYGSGVDVFVHYNGTCDDFFSKSSSVSTMPIICTDCLLFCKQVTDGYCKTDTITYDGTMAQWKTICPSSLANIETICSDGTLNAPLPESDNYTFSRDGTASFIGNLSADTETLVIPETVEGYTVTSIGESACEGFSKLTSLSIPDSVTSVGDYAFLNCQNLLDISIPASVEKIGSYAFGYWQNSDGSYSRMGTVTIHCDAGSAAEQYAIDNGFNYSYDPIVTVVTTTVTTTTTTTTTTTNGYIPETKVTTKMEYTTELSKTTTTTVTEPYFLSGDVNMDGVISLEDAELVEEEYERVAVGYEWSFTDAQRLAADVNGDGRIDMGDVAIIRQMAGYVETTTTVPTTTTTSTTTSTTASGKLPSEIVLKVGETADIRTGDDGYTFTSADVKVAAVSSNGIVIGVSVGETYIVVEDSDGNMAVVKVIVTDGTATTTTAVSTVDALYGDINLDGNIDLTDAIMLNKYCADVVKLSVPAFANADCTADGNVDMNDSIALLRFLVHIISALPSAE